MTYRSSFSVYTVCDDGNGNSEISEKDEIWTLDYTHDKELKYIGKITSLDFNNSCTSFVTGSNLGWICIWGLEHRELKSKFKISLDDCPERLLQCDLLRDFNDERLLIHYENKSMNLFCTYSYVVETECNDRENIMKISDITRTLKEQHTYT
jgi:hypothetical protein